MKALQILGLGLSLAGCAPGMPYYPMAGYRPPFSSSMPVSVMPSGAEYAGNSPYSNRHYVLGGPESCPYRQGSPACVRWDHEVLVETNKRFAQRSQAEAAQLAARGIIIPAPPSEDYVMHHLPEMMAQSCYNTLRDPFAHHPNIVCENAWSMAH